MCGKIMGWATRWLKDLFGARKKRERASGCSNQSTMLPNISASEAAWLRSFYDEVEKERQAKHAVAVAAASAAAADAALNAAKAAAAVVRLTNHARGPKNKENRAAVKIQSGFRGYLARRALKALKGLVKLQAHVRGYLVRKQAKATLISMQALFRVQASKREAKMVTDGSSDESTKIVEVDPSIYLSKGKCKSRRNNLSSVSDMCEELALHRLSSPVADDRILGVGAQLEDEDDFKYATAHSTPRLGTYSESEYGRRASKNKSSRQYMASTQSSSARVRSASAQPSSVTVRSASAQPSSVRVRSASAQPSSVRVRSASAPKQRPEVRSRKKISLSDLMESRRSLSGIGIGMPSYYSYHDATNFKSFVMGKFDERLSWSHNWG